MQVPWQIFRAYDIRGRASGRDAPLTPELVAAIGRKFAEMLREESASPRCVVAGDQRASTPALRAALIDGLRAAGVDILDIGLSPSPLAYWAAAQSGAERPTAAAIVTASHNPPDQNGVKLVHASTLPLRPEEIQALGRRIEKGGQREFPSGPARRGALQEWDPTPQYLASLAAAGENLDGLQIVADPGNGVAALTGPPALAAIGGQVETVNGDLRAAPAHPADPQHAANVEQLCAAVRNVGAPLGLAWDGDGDRLGVVDGRGLRAEPDRVMALLARDYLAARPGAPIHVDVKTSQAVIEDIRAHGGQPRIGPVGHSLAKHAMQTHGINFGGEPSCHYYERVAAPAHITDDAVRAACQIARICARGLAGRTPTLEQQLDAIPSWRASPEVQLPCADEEKFAAAAQAAQAFALRVPIIAIDGARADYSHIEPGAWALVRASNTNPVLTVRFEARTDKAYAQVREEVRSVLEEAGVDAEPLAEVEPAG